MADRDENDDLLIELGINGEQMPLQTVNGTAISCLPNGQMLARLDFFSPSSDAQAAGFIDQPQEPNSLGELLQETIHENERVIVRGLGFAMPDGEIRVSENLRDLAGMYRSRAAGEISNEGVSPSDPEFLRNLRRQAELACLPGM